MSQPAVLIVRWNWRTACSVITVFGADVPDGNALTSWILGFARQEPGWQGELGPEGRLLYAPYWSCISGQADRPGRMVRMSASGLTCAAVMP